MPFEFEGVSRCDSCRRDYRLTSIGNREDQSRSGRPRSRGDEVDDVGISECFASGRLGVLWFGRQIARGPVVIWQEQRGQRSTREAET